MLNLLVTVSQCLSPYSRPLLSFNTQTCDTGKYDKDYIIICRQLIIIISLTFFSFTLVNNIVTANKYTQHTSL